MDDRLQYQSSGAASASSEPRRYRPWTKGRVWAAFILGMHAAVFMTFFFIPWIAFLGFCTGLPAVILTGIEIRQFKEARASGPVKWARITGLIGLIGGPICTILFGLLFVAFVGALSALGR
jgi:hypothetical protein